MEVKTRGGEEEEEEEEGEEEETTKEDDILTRLRNGLHQTNRRSLKIFCLSAKLTSTTTQIDDDLTRHSVARARIDRQLMTYLTQNDVINWTQQTCRLAPVKRSRTDGGDGLLWSIVAVIWNLWDSSSNVELLLRRLLHVTLTTGRQNSAFHERWKTEEQTQRHQSPQVDWKNVCSLFKGDNVDNVLSGSDSLDPIHLFSLSNVLRRPIFVIDDIAVSASNEKTTKDDLSGVYLPLLSSADDCVPHPVLLLHSDGVFCPLLVEKRRLERSGMLPFQAVPLVRFDQEPFHVRCLLGSEQKRVHELMTSYLKVAEIGRNDGSASRVPVARVASNSTTMSRLINNSPRSKVNEQRTENVSGCLESHETKLEDFSSGNRDETKNPLEDAVFCCPEYLDEKRKDKAANNSSRRHPTVSRTSCTDSEKCRSTGCTKEGSKKYGHQCYACYVQNDDDFEPISGRPEKQETTESGQTIPHKLQTASRGTAFTNRHQSLAEGNNVIEDTKNDAFNSRTEGLSDDETHAEAEKEFDLKEVGGMTDSASKDADDNEGLMMNSADDELSDANSSKKTKLERGSKLEGDSVEPICEEWKTSKEEEEEQEEEDEAGKCIVNFCENAGRKASNGICKVCYDTLLQHRLRKQNDEKEPDLQCLTEGCPKAVTNRQLGLCLSCLRQQILAARDLERRASCNSQRTSSSSSDVRGWTTASPTIAPQTHALCSQQQQQQRRRHALRSAGDVFTEEEEVEVEENWLEATKTKRHPPHHQRRSSLQIISSPPLRSGKERATAARPCLTVDCDRHGDPRYQGLCGECFRQFSHSYGKRSASKNKH